jgi:hypothetical protein
MLKLIGNQENGVYRFEITMDMLNMTNHMDMNISLSNMFYENLVIPLERLKKRTYEYDSIYYFLLEQSFEECADKQLPQLNLIIQDDILDNKRHYYLAALIKLDNQDKNAVTYELSEIQLDQKEIEVLNFAFIDNSIKIKVG